MRSFVSAASLDTNFHLNISSVQFQISLFELQPKLRYSICSVHTSCLSLSEWHITQGPVQILSQNQAEDDRAYISFTRVHKYLPSDKKTNKIHKMFKGREVVFQCRDEGPLRARVQWTRLGGNRQLPPGARDVNGRLEIPNIKVIRTFYD